MILKKVHVTNFKCVKDSSPFSIDPKVTCLVGKNEAGKTAVLESLYKLRPVRHEDGNLDVTREYFRPSVLEYKARHEKQSEPAVTSWWDLEEEDWLALEKKIGPAARSVRNVEIAKHFNNTSYYSFQLDEGEVVKGLIAASAMGSKEKGKLHASSVQQLLAQLGATPEEEQQRATLIQDIKNRFGEKTAKKVAIDVLSERLPRFAFFSQYLRMPGQLSVDQFKARVEANQLTDEDKVFTSLLDMIGMSIDSFLTVSTYEDLMARLEAASEKLTRELRNFWPDGKHLRMEFKFDDALAGDLPPFNVGKVFRARIKNERYGVTTAFDQRSSGFIFFFSFLVWFSQMKKNYKTDLIILLDEPGMALHGSAQRELLRFIDQRLAKEYQVLYTTHSPFMLDPSNLHRARPVEDVYLESNRNDEEEDSVSAQGTRVFEQWWNADKLTLFPLRGCLAYELTQTLFIGEHCLLVEGPADLLYIDWFKRKLISLNRPSLDKHWVVTPCGSISKIGAFLNLFGANHLHCAILCDYADGGKREVKSLGEIAVLASAEVLTADQFAGKPQADLEDLLGDAGYADLVNRCYGLTGADAFVPPPGIDATPTGRIVKAVEEHMRLVPSAAEFTHPGPADFLLRQGVEFSFTEMGAALDRFQALFEKLNSILAQNLESNGGGKK